MVKPKVIIADEDYVYISTFVAKFVNDYYEKIELEVITDREYFNQYFSMPQNADVLIVSEALYNQEIKRHNIKTIFALVENEEQDETGELDVTRIFKYTSLKEIFNLIIGKSGEIFKAGISELKESKIILVTSMLGGAGKTTIAMGLAANLAENYKKVLYIDAEKLQVFQFRMNNATYIKDNQVYNSLINQHDGIYRVLKKSISKEIFNYVPPFKAAILSLGIDSFIYEKIAIEAKDSGDFDFIVIDTDSTFNEEKLSLLDASDNVVVITTQDEYAINATNYFARNINGINTGKYIFVCNKFQQNVLNAIETIGNNSNFTVNEYIRTIEAEKDTSIEALAKNNDIKKLSFLVM